MFYSKGADPAMNNLCPLSAWLIFAVSAAFAVYTVAGYPLLVSLLARRHPRPIQKGTQLCAVTIILPVFNGASWILRKLESIGALEYPAHLVQVIVISDGSTDETTEIAERFASLASNVEVLHIPNSGKAVALNHGMARARGDILFFTDVRQPLKSDCLLRLIECFADPRVGGVCGELIILDGETREEASVGLYWKLEKWLRTQLSSMGTLLVVTGCLYAVRRKLAEPVPAGVLGDDIFMPQTILRKGFRVVFQSAAKAYDFPIAGKIEFRRKVRTLAGLYQHVARYGMGPYPFHFFSYKITRLLLPYALLSMLIASFFLPRGLLGIQLLGYLLAGLNGWIGERSPLKKLSSPAYTFCMLMAASVWALSVFFVPSGSLWKTTHVRTPKMP